MEYKDIVSCVLSKLEIKDIITCSLTSKLLKEVCEMQYYRLLNHDYGNILEKIFIKKSFKQTYIDCYELDIFRMKYSKMDNLVNFFSVDGLKLCCKKITALPETIGQLSNLQELWLDNNQIIVLPESIGQLSNLQYLSLSNNQITVLPESIGQLSNLQELWLNNNQITVLPESIGQLSNLQIYKYYIYISIK